MVKIFDIENGRVIINPHCLLIPELKALRENYEGIEVFCYVAFLFKETIDNPYGNLEKDIRKEVLLKDFPGAYRPSDELVCKAIDKLQDLYETPITKYFKQVRGLLEKVGNYAATVIIDDGKEGNMTHVLKIIKEVGMVAKQFADAEKVKLEDELKGKGGKALAYDQR